MLIPLLFLGLFGLAAAAGRDSCEPAPQPPGRGTTRRWQPDARGAERHGRAFHRSSQETRTSAPPIAGCLPSPLDVLDEAIRSGQVPSPALIDAAIHEAIDMGRHDVASAIAHSFSVGQEGQENWAAPCDAPPSMPPSMLHPSELDPAIHDPAIHDPAIHGITGPDQVDFYAPDMGAHPGHPSLNPQGGPSIVDALDTDDEEDPGAPAITVSGQSSPIPQISNRDWSSFVDRVSRECPTFTAQRHLGRFRHNRSRLAELGIDPGTIERSPDAQVNALAVDMSDAYTRMQANGLLDQFLGQQIDVPTPQGEWISAQVTRSGILGVVHAAGIDNARNWLLQSSDRTKFPGTTDTFLRTNGLF